MILFDVLSSYVNQIQRGSTCIGLVLNFIIIQLIVHRSPPNLGVYKYLMMYTAAFEFFFGVIELMTVPDIYTQDSSFFVIVDSQKTFFPAGMLNVVDLIFCCSFGVSLAIFAVQFVYRYQVLSGGSSWTERTTRNLAIWIASPLVFAAVWTTSCVVFMGRNQYAEKVLRESVSLIIPNIDSIGFVGVIFYPVLDDGTSVINWDSWIGMAICSTILLGTETTMAYYGVRCYLATNRVLKSAEQSSKFRRLQSQLFYALVSQTVIPIFFMQLPLTMIYISTFLNSSSQFFGKFQALTVSFYLATDALPTMFIIKSYREAVLDFFHNIREAFRCVRPDRRQTSETGTSMAVISS